jgi:saccharopine dehydrogenase-like NADP-dependent oxidoreductase
MKIIVLGGAGDMGSRAVEDLAASTGVEIVTIADRNVAAAQKLASRLQGRGARVDIRPVDAGDHRSLVEAMRGYDVAASALGPFYRFETKLATAAVEAGAHYASVCDDWSAAQAVLAEVDEPARRAGRIVLTGLGASPGVTNVGIRHLVGQLDRVRRVDVNVYQPLTAGGGEAVLKHMLYIISGDVAGWRQGGQVMLPACSEAHMVEFPRYGRIKVWNMGHTEPVTIPRFISGLEECNFFMGFGRGAALFVWPARRGLFASDRRIDAVARLMAPIERLTGGREPKPGAIRVDVWGEKEGEEVHKVVCGLGQMRDVTGLSLSVGAQMVARGEVLEEGGGAYAPEACLEPEPFMTAMREKGLEAYADLAMTKPFP